MTVYPDEVFALNCAVNCCLLRTAVVLTGGRGGGRLLLGAAFGGLWAAAAVLPGLGALGRLPLGTAAYAVLCLLSFGCRGRAWKSWLWFFGVCCCFAGLALAAAALLRVPVLLSGGRVYYRVSGLLLVLLALGLDLVCRLCLRCFARHRGGELTVLTLKLGDRQVGCTALRDNGNTLRDPISGQPVLVAGWPLAARLLPDPGLCGEAFAEPAALMERLSRTAPELRTRLIPYRAVGTEGGILLAVRLDQVLDNGRPAPIRLLAVSPTELSDGGLYEAVLPGA